MKKGLLKIGILLFTVLLALSCSKEGSYKESTESPGGDFALASDGGGSDRFGGGEGGGDGGDGQQQQQPGVITAGEWNDLDSWSFWNSIIGDSSYRSMPEYWKFYNNNRVSVKVLTGNGVPVANAVVELQRNSTTIFAARTDNFGKAELWVDLFQKSSSVDYSTISIAVNGNLEKRSAIPYSQGVNEITVNAAQPANRIEIALVVDATGSMGDELEYIKTELVDVVRKVKSNNSQASIYTSSVFYRDEGDEYVTRISNFSSDILVTNDFINNQSANGGGDFPEAVHTALEKAVGELQWSSDAKTRLMFLILDAPPHYEDDVIASIQNSIREASRKGIKIIPVTASGIDKETEFMMRFMALSTGGTYVFITNDSGIGNDHLTPSVGEYQVEFLNDLLVRLINKYSE
ncbi:MAG: VWA domain-containing protein [Tannerella sp.]|jgi:hypothetical protein|nr:VWA domain-containing protein [Tannerella sp.]